MNLITKFRAAQRRVLIAIWHSLWQRSDVGLRRMCVMASLHAQLVQCGAWESGRLAELNNRMRLVSDNSANSMRLPTLYGTAIWRGIPNVEKIDLSSERIVVRIIRSMPCWLNYGSEDLLRSDIKCLLGFCAEQKAVS